MNSLTKGTVQKKKSTCDSKSPEVCPFKHQKSKHSKADASIYIQNANQGNNTLFLCFYLHRHFVNFYFPICFKNNFSYIMQQM